MTYISKSLQLRFQEFCVYLALRQIDAIFQTAGVTKSSLLTPSPQGERRTRVMEYYTSINWNNFDDCQKFIEVIQIALAQTYFDEATKVELRNICSEEGLIVDGNKIYFGIKGVDGKAKNIIFAANGPKPKIVMVDAINNDIRITKNEEYCLVYDRTVNNGGLKWDDLVDWWLVASGKTLSGRPEYQKDLYMRLYSAITSEPEKLVFDTYFRKFKDILPNKLPALIPQVYLHYDPYTITYLQETKDLARQRMDFLMLLSPRDRIVIEVDGVQHYANDKQASPKLYAEMVAEDRRLKLGGYEVYRFGGYELQGEIGKTVIINFFEKLFQTKNILNP